MSLHNKSKDRDAQGNIKKKYRGKSTRKWYSTPHWWIRDLMNVPKRRENVRLCSSIVRGEDPDDVVFPLGNRKPHIYYW